MKKTSVSTILGIIWSPKCAILCLGTLLCALVFWLGGCGSMLGETEAEVNRRHLRNSRINKQELAGDLDRVMLVDKPSKLSNKRIP